MGKKHKHDVSDTTLQTFLIATSLNATCHWGVASTSIHACNRTTSVSDTHQFLFERRNVAALQTPATIIPLNRIGLSRTETHCPLENKGRPKIGTNGITRDIRWFFTSLVPPSFSPPTRSCCTIPRETLQIPHYFHIVNGW